MLPRSESRLFKDELLDSLKVGVEDLSRKTDNSFEIGDPVDFIKNGINAVVDDSFSRCFRKKGVAAWNWNFYLAFLWVLGLIVRYCILFPVRLVILILGFIVAFTTIAGVQLFVKDKEKKVIWGRRCATLLCSAFTMSWSAVINYHGTKPTPPVGEPAGVFVANHSTMIDFIILQQTHSFAVVGQKHKGFVGFLQDTACSALNPVWFERGETRNRQAAFRKFQEHVKNPSNLPLLVFPEGTCVNNEYVVQFKKGVFDLDTVICPVAIKYNRIFSDCYWHSREQSFLEHLFHMMTSWAVVCDVWFLEPQVRHKDETSVEFADRVKEMIAKKANLKSVPWNGYLKYWKPNERFVKSYQTEFAMRLRERGPIVLDPEEPSNESVGLDLESDNTNGTSPLTNSPSSSNSSIDINSLPNIPRPVTSIPIQMSVSSTSDVLTKDEDNKLIETIQKEEDNTESNFKQIEQGLDLLGVSDDNDDVGMLLSESEAESDNNEIEIEKQIEEPEAVLEEENMNIDYYVDNEENIGHEEEILDDESAEELVDSVNTMRI
eukprot:TRINITY_DN6623_c0_g1_i1.p1 TRINITY_DN6623_c0_g1~~TRINITY_DN6623_c0_g1_i1.p1  ORF type:complete len:547 (-),score=164.37 TRINITY_DN6623_c0_g1_i1:173-1813(-)